MSQEVRTRFAPSPTGSLHVGNLRLAVFNQVFARKYDGAFVIRVEDTDFERNVEGSLESILEDLSWVGLDWDEGPDRDGPFGPYLQSQRTERHHERALELERLGLAYRCFCTDEETRSDRAGARTSPRCPGHCKDLEPGEVTRRRTAGIPSAIRFTVPDSDVVVADEIRGDVSFRGNDIGDFVILRADDRATYNFAVVVDDVDMRISHVIRGSGHLSNTPKQALLFDALGSPRPVFAHLPTVLGPDGTKLSKRTGAPGVRQLREMGYHPDGVVNYLSLLGWSPGDDREVLSREELIEAIDLAGARASNTEYDPEKLRWMSAQHIARMTLADLASTVDPFVDRSRFPLDAEEVEAAVEALRTRLHTFAEINEYLPILYPDPETLERGRAELAAEASPVVRLLEAVRARLDALDDWTPDRTGAAVRQAGKDAGARGAALFHPVRTALTGNPSGPDLGLIACAIGRDRTFERIDTCIDFLQEK